MMGRRFRRPQGGVEFFVTDHAGVGLYRGWHAFGIHKGYGTLRLGFLVVYW